MIPIEYASDPWEARQKGLVAASARAVEEKKNPWDDYPILYIPKELRERLEKMIRDNLDLAVQEQVLSDSSKDTSHVRALLLKKGFKSQHVDVCSQIEFMIGSIAISKYGICCHGLATFSRP
jgi:hypothetical protein